MYTYSYWRNMALMLMESFLFEVKKLRSEVGLMQYLPIYSLRCKGMSTEKWSVENDESPPEGSLTLWNRKPPQ